MAIFSFLKLPGSGTSSVPVKIKSDDEPTASGSQENDNPQYENLVLFESGEECQVTLGSRLAVGGSAQVFMCTLKTKTSEQLAAAKVVPADWAKLEKDHAGRDALLQECTIWQRVSAERHPHIATLYGAASTPSSLVLAVEYFGGGCMHGELTRLRAAGAPPPSPTALCAQLRQIASAMAWLHGMSPPVLHRDIKSANVLLRGPRLALTDFGVARTLAPDGKAMTAETGSYRWMAPEVVTHQLYDERCDVYSFGITAWELLTYRVPFGEVNDVQAAYVAAFHGQRPPLDVDAVARSHPHDVVSTGDAPQVDEYAALRELIASCWAHQASARPSFAALLQALASEPSAPAAADARLPDLAVPNLV